MRLTVAISTHPNYYEYLDLAALTALEFADEVLICDNGGEHGPFGNARYFPLPLTENCTEARKCAIENATGDRILHLDGDDWLLKRPPLVEGEWVFSNLMLSTGDVWDYSGLSYAVDDVWARLERDGVMPCGKGTFDMAWLRKHDLSWYSWPSTMFAEDVRTMIEYLTKNPRIVYVPGEPFYCYRQHEDQTTKRKGVREVFAEDLGVYLAERNSRRDQP